MRKVAICGMGVISPVGNGVPEFWSNIKAGVCAVDRITKFDTTDFKVKLACEVRGFDPLNYMEKSEARKQDLFTQYAVAAADEAVRDSEIAGAVTPERLGVYFGSGIGGMNTFALEHDHLLNGGPRRVSPFFIPMLISNMAAGTIAIIHNAQGPCLPVVTACATSTHAIGEAYRAIAYGYADAIIAGGAEAAVTPLAVAGFTSCKALTETEDKSAASIPFDARRSGFVMGEGAGAVVLEEYEHAKARGAKIYALVEGYANTCDAHHITAPHPEAFGAARAIRLAADEAGYTDDDTVYINAHGTSTILNDKAETIAIKQAFKEASKYIHVDSTKSMTGHMLGAAGAVEAIVSAKALEEGVVPPTVGLCLSDIDCDLDYTPQTAKAAKLTLALSTSLGFGGHNGVLAFRRAE
ncbi:MAG: beta-ketoacyl-ACP synthase II [Clostridia bacterium]|nr:beta-ketoacyl-ACP synthase II [Clostridia bacterium]